MRISDWSSDVCSSDLRDELKMSVLAKIMLAERFAPELYDALARGSANTGASEGLAALEAVVAASPSDLQTKSADGRSEERRVVKECVSTSRSRWSTYH